MNRFFAFLLSCVFFGTAVFAQEKVITHKVAKGETITQIAQKYKVSPHEIYQLNPDAQSGISTNMVLLISKAAVKNDSKTTAKPMVATKTIMHEVVAKETLFGIQKKYDISEAALFKANPFLEKDGLQIGQKLLIPNAVMAKAATPATVKVVAPVLHVVQAQETKFSIAKKYNITIEELEKKNPEVATNLPIGFTLLIKGNRPKEIKDVSVTASKIEPEKNDIDAKNTSPLVYQNYTVKPKETFYSLSKLTGLSQEELTVLNPDLKNGVQEGMLLKLPSNVKLETVPLIQKNKTQLSVQNAGTAKKIVLLLPFNTAKIANDTVNSSIERLKKDKFLNMTLDFYAGALMAIDSAKQMGIQVDVQVFDSQETKNSSQVPTLIKNHSINTAQVVIGPFYQNNVEKAAELLLDDNIAVISPLSKEFGKSYANLYQSIVSSDELKNTAFDFMKKKNGNMIAVIDKKKESSRIYFAQQQKDVKIAPLTPTGGVNVEALKSLLSLDRMNYVILETGSTTMIRATIAAMISVMKTHKVQLVILEPNPTLDTDEISFANLVKLQLLYPSAIRENNSDEAQVFAQKYRKENNVYPSSFATRGFDVTFDTLMRMAQDVTFQETMESTATEQVENRFDYSKNEGGAYNNKGVYMLYYDADMTIKQAN
ncbi:peptidoglycan-binding protein [Flavobacterium sp. LM5]|uniref:LysM peptidoglycan-binding domain-containing protein n=1 Tax=Flavobacterium sp. LM5 TaxID=1938610 RepID=UPI000992974E|nr:LysM domain-containing protein [Flavobacterium sp. LM5]OOV27661.1 peptidoglycan-binding protein [Flavobacterium sp. LM5]